MAKKILFLFLSIIYAMSINAQTKNVSDGILFQAVATDANGNAAKNKTIYVRNAVIKNSPTGEVVYSESFQVTSSEEGIFTIVVGKGQRINGANTLSAIDWSTSSFFLNLKIAIPPAKQSSKSSNWVLNLSYI